MPLDFVVSEVLAELSAAVNEDGAALEGAGPIYLDIIPKLHEEKHPLTNQARLDAGLCYRMLSGHRDRDENIETAHNLFDDVITHPYDPETHDLEIGEAYYGRADLRRLEGNLPQAEHLNRTGMKALEYTGNVISLPYAKLLDHLGLIHTAMNEPHLALAQCMMADAICARLLEETPDDRDVLNRRAQIQHRWGLRLGEVYGDDPEAIQKGIDLNQATFRTMQTLQNMQGMYNSLASIGRLHAQGNDFKNAVIFEGRAWGVASHMKNGRSIAGSSLYLAHYYFQLGQAGDAISDLHLFHEHATHLDKNDFTIHRDLYNSVMEHARTESFHDKQQEAVAALFDTSRK